MRATMIAGVLLSAACAGTPRQVKVPAAALSAEAKAAAEQEKRDRAKLVCTWERPTGSNIPEKVCRYPEQIEEDYEATQRMLHSTPGAQVIKG
jgi:hypothetical protein